MDGPSWLFKQQGAFTGSHGGETILDFSVVLQPQTITRGAQISCPCRALPKLQNCKQIHDVFVLSHSCSLDCYSSIDSTDNQDSYLKFLPSELSLTFCCLGSPVSNGPVDYSWHGLSIQLLHPFFSLSLLNCLAFGEEIDQSPKVTYLLFLALS